MRKIAFLIAASIGGFVCAQFTSPGNGTTYTLTSLSAAAPTVLVNNGSDYTMTNDITILATDKLLMDENTTVKVDAGKALYVYGEYQTTANNLVITASDSNAPFKGIQFEVGSSAEMKNTTVEYGGGIRVLTENFIMDNCIVKKNVSGVATNGAVSLFRGSPVIKNSQFIENYRAGIGSGTSSAASVTIENNYLFGNNTGNNNSPQINIGMSVTDSVRVINNTVIGNRELTKVGGISVSMLLGSATRFRIEGNTVKNNRYGINTQGANAEGIIKNNILEYNDTETVPANGGSGISLYSIKNVIVRNNQIRNNLWGVTMPTTGIADLGTEADPGNNIFKDNANSGNTIAFFNNTDNTISAVGNCWREGELSTDEMVEAVIGRKNPGTIIYKPYDCAASLSAQDTKVQKLKLFPNPSNGNFTLETEKSGNYVLTDLSGKILDLGIISKGKNNFSKNLAPGMYVLVFQSEGKKTSEKIIIK
ncbi:MAG: T9SS type A sorting domain-containing protein [Bergeyella sp.]